MYKYMWRITNICDECTNICGESTNMCEECTKVGEEFMNIYVQNYEYLCRIQEYP
jgi:hypothetical protein